MSKSIDQIPIHDRPREKLLAKGAAALSDQELLAVLLGKGTAQMDVMTLAAKLVRVMDEKGLQVRPDDLTGLDGVGEAKATLLLAAIEFARRRIKPEGTKIETPADVLPLIRQYADRKQEHFLAITINGANEVQNVRVISIGLIDRSPVHPRGGRGDRRARRRACDHSRRSRAGNGRGSDAPSRGGAWCGARARRVIRAARGRGCPPARAHAAAACGRSP